MGLRIFLIAIVFSFSWGVFAQDSVQRAFGAQYSFQSQDFFFGVHVSFQRRSLEHLTQFQTGVRTTFFQQRPFPQLAYQFCWYGLNFERFRAGLSVRSAFSAIHSKKDSSHGFAYYEDFLPGLKLGFGKKNRVALSAMYGPYLEQRYSDLSRQYYSYLSWKFNAEVSYSYVF